MAMRIREVHPLRVLLKPMIAPCKENYEVAITSKKFVLKNYKFVFSIKICYYKFVM